MFFGPNVPSGQYPNIKGIAPKRVVLQKPWPRITAITTRAWNGKYAAGAVEGKQPAIGGFRLANNAGDYLARQNYSCGGATQTNASKPGTAHLIGSVTSKCDGSKIPPSTCNTKFVYDSSDYVTYRKQKAINRNRTDYSYGGNKSNGSYVPLMRVRH